MKIIVSNTSRFAYRGVVEQLRANLSGSASNVVIAPDRFTASVERGIISSLGIDSSFGIEVMSFTRLAAKLLGKSIAKCLTPEGSVMLINKVIAENRASLKFYGKVATLDGFDNELYAALTAIRNSGITARALRENANGMPEQLKRKALDIALIFEKYLEALGSAHSDSSTRLMALAKFIEQNPDSVSSTHFYCTDIYEFSAPELEIVAQLAHHALSFTVGLTSGYDNPNRRIYPDRVIAKLKDAVPDKVQIEYNNEPLCAPIDAISTQLFSYCAPENIPENGGKVTLRVAKDVSEEALALAIDIVKKVRGGGRYRDIEVFVSDMDSYVHELKSVFARYDIPFFIDKKELLSEQTKVRYLLAAIACVRSGMRRREVLDLVKNPLFDVDENEVSEFENYVLKYNIDFSRFLEPFSLEDENLCRKRQFINAKYIDKAVKLRYESESVVPERVRETLAATLVPFMSEGKIAPAAKRRISQYVEAARIFLSQSDEAWQRHAERVEDLSRYYKKCAEQVDSKLDSVLEELESVRDDEMDMQGFEQVLKAMLRSLKIALVPTYLDCVFVGDIDSRFMGAGDIYILGATIDKFPSVASGGIIITPADEAMLDGLGIKLTPNERQKTMTNMYAVCDLMKKPHGRLVISYPEMGDGGALRPSVVISELKGMLSEGGEPLGTERINIRDFSAIKLKNGNENYLAHTAELFATEKSCLYEALRNVNVYEGADTPIYSAARECIDQSDRRKLTVREPGKIELPKNMYLMQVSTVSRLETFFACPYEHYLQYILQLKKRKDDKPEGTENGIILHSVLEHFFSDVRDGKITSEQQIDALAYAYFDSAVRENGFERLLSVGETRRPLLRLKEEGARVCRQLYSISLRSSFAPVYLEAKIGEGSIKPMSLTVGENIIALKGTIDRVDMCGNDFIVVDYKSYKSVDLTLKDVYYGLKLQLYIYMRAVEDSLSASPAGVFYLPIYAGFTKDNVNRYKFCGQVSDSVETMRRIDSMTQNEPYKAVIPYKYTKKNGLDGDVHFAKADFDMLGDYAMALAAKGAEQIADGYIKPAPIKGRCDRCGYRDICGYSDSDERRVGSVKKSSFDLSDEPSTEGNSAPIMEREVGR